MKHIHLKYFVGVCLCLIYIYIFYCYSNHEYYNNQKSLIYQTQSKYQTIQLYNDTHNNFSLYLNNEIQIKKNQYHISHYFQCYLTVLKYKPSTVLILGGGDLLCSSYVLQFPCIKKVVLVEIDKKMIHMVKQNKIMNQITNNVITNPKLKIIIGDAYEYIRNTKENYDMIIEDIELDFTKQHNKTLDEYEYFVKCLHISDIFVTTHNIGDNSTMEYDYEYPSIRTLMKPFQHKHYKQYQYTLYTDDKIKLCQELEYKKSTIQKLMSNNIFNQLNIYVLGYEHDDEFGYEGYVVFERKK